MADESFESHKDTIDTILSVSTRYVVPPHQRNFAWNPEKVETFWNDLKSSIINKDEDYFFGSVIFQKTEEKEVLEIIDGQQRLATITILLAAIRDILYDITKGKGKKDADAIHSNYILKELEKGKQIIKLTLNLQNKDFFFHCIQCRLDDSKRQSFSEYKKNNPKFLKSNKLISRAYDFLREALEKETSKMGDLKKIDYLTDISMHVRTFLIINTTVNSDEEAYMLFETLNDRGLELNIADLFKNYLLRKTPERKKNDTIRIWTEIENLLEISTMKGSGIRGFLRHYWLSKYNRVIQERKLLRELKERVEEDEKGKRDIPDIYEFLLELNNEAKIYKMLLSPENQDWADKSIVDLLEDFNVLNIRQCLPVLLAGKIKYDESNFKELLGIIINFTFRYSTICNKHNNVLEDRYNKIAVGIRNGKIKSPKDRTFLKQLKVIDPDVNEFEDSFRRKKFKNNEVARYILKKIDDDMSPSERETKDLTLEHIIPKDPEKWKEFLKKKKMWKDREDLIYTIGNLTLLEKADNIKISNNIFDTKKFDAFANTTLKINDYIKNAKEWTREEIEKRENKLIGKASGLWKL